MNHRRNFNGSGLTDAVWMKLWGIVRKLRPYALRLAGGRAGDAEDIASAALLKAAEALAGGTPWPDNEGAWVRTIMKRHAVDLARRRRTRQQLLGSHGAAEQVHGVAVELPDRPVEREADRIAVARTMGRLPPSYAQVLTLRYMDDVAYPDIARAHGITEPNARKRCQLARRDLARALADAGYD